MYTTGLRGSGKCARASADVFRYSPHAQVAHALARPIIILLMAGQEGSFMMERSKEEDFPITASKGDKSGEAFYAVLWQVSI